MCKPSDSLIEIHVLVPYEKEEAMQEAKKQVYKMRLINKTFNFNSVIKLITCSVLQITQKKIDKTIFKTTKDFNNVSDNSGIKMIRFRITPPLQKSRKHVGTWPEILPEFKSYTGLIV